MRKTSYWERSQVNSRQTTPIAEPTKAEPQHRSMVFQLNPNSEHLATKSILPACHLTSDYTESCRQVLKHRCLTAEMFYSTDKG